MMSSLGGFRPKENISTAAWGSYSAPKIKTQIYSY